jgi:tetratricopeptide (TPR) repeat protein
MAGRGYYGSAIKLYEQVLARDPAFWLANYQLGYTYFRLGKFDEAEEYLNRAIAISSTRPDPFLYLGLTRLERGRLGAAAEALWQAIRIRPEGEGYHLALGTVLELQGDFAGALAAFRRELALNPKQQAARDKITQIDTGLRSVGPEPSSPAVPSGQEKKK